MTPEWEPYRPPGYPIEDRFHNPFVTVDPISGATGYTIWRQDPDVAPEHFRAMLAAMSPYRD